MQYGNSSALRYKAVSTSVLLVVLLLLAYPLAARSEPNVKVSKSGESYQVDVRMDVVGSRALVWRVLTDYENLPRFVPGMKSSRILEDRGGTLLLEQTGESGILFVRVTTTTVSRIFENPENEIRFELVSGNLKKMQGAWTLVPHGHVIGLIYRAELIPEFSLPPFIGTAAMAQNVKTMVEGVAREIGRRNSSGTKE